ncbi:MAG: hypothetical protein IPL06_17515 [Betaproteobacteria bacterium]|nr:hypothetical protein [Betaproteobacteria bacterium]
MPPGPKADAHWATNCWICWAPPTVAGVNWMRSELPLGVTEVINGALGAPRKRRTRLLAKSPMWTIVFASRESASGFEIAAPCGGPPSPPNPAVPLPAAVPIVGVEPGNCVTLRMRLPTESAM